MDQFNGNNDTHHHDPDLGMQDFAEKSNLFNIMASLMRGLLLEQPEKPIEWLIEALQKPEGTDISCLYRGMKQPFTH